jgi:hypothetical protein
MPDYRRARVRGSVLFTVNLRNRSSNLLITIDLLRGGTRDTGAASLSYRYLGGAP